MDVDLIEHTASAAELLIFTKQTRMEMTPGMYDAIKEWSDERKQAELDYMLHTIQSSWEFVDYVFLITGAPRSLTHQLVRTRTASYAQQSQRLDNYSLLVKQGADPQDAREVLPNATCSNIVMKCNLRTLHDFMLKRLCVRAQGPAQDIARGMRDRVIEVHPWAEKFLRVWCATIGTCQFHNHPMSKCPVKPYVYNPHTARSYSGHVPETLEIIQRIWENERASPQPTIHRTA
jgi:hypothetical protein